MKGLLESRKGQVTIYIILGILILGGFLAALYLVNLFTEEKLSGEQRRIISSVLESSAVNFYAQACLEDALEEGLVILGRQGGVIYTNQSGVTERNPSESVNYLGEDIDLAIKAKQPELPMFPCSSGSLPDYCRYPREGEDYFFGISGLPPLTGNVFSIQGQLEYFVEEKIQGCLKELVENQSLGAQIELGEQRPDASVVFGQGVTVVRMDYPVKVKTGFSGQVSQFLHWTARTNVRFREIYKVAADMVEDDNIQIGFDISRDIYNSSAYLPNIFYENLEQGRGMKFEMKRDATGNYDLLTLNDTFSRIKDKPYIFRMARQNRQPALEYVYLDPSPVYDYLLIEGEKMDLVLKAEDPDEDLVRYYFLANNSLLSGQHSGSSLERETGAGDAGFYNITARVDDSYLADSQTVRVLVDKKLGVDFSVRGLYAGISQEDPIMLNVSTTESLAYGPEYFYYWQRPFENIGEENCLVLPGLEVNCSTALSLGGFETLPIETINENMPAYLSSGIFRVEVTLLYNNETNRSQVNSSSRTLSVPQCVYYPNTQHPFPYPYHNYGAEGRLITENFNPYLANHACCTIDNTHADDKTICFQGNEVYYEQGVQLNKTVRRFCSGDRGNICSGSFANETKCGFDATVDAGCRGEKQFDLVNGGWCYGKAGCEKFCQNPSVIIDADNDKILDGDDVCGTCWGYNGNGCDPGFDGQFEKTCTLGSCV